MSDDLKTKALQEALTAAREITDEHVRVKTLVSLNPKNESNLNSEKNKIDEITRMLLEILQKASVDYSLNM